MIFSVFILAAQLVSDPNPATQPGAKYQYLCTEVTNADERYFAWVQVDSFPSRTPRSHVSIRLEEKKEDGNYRYKYSMASFLAVPKVIVQSEPSLKAAPILFSHHRSDYQVEVAESASFLYEDKENERIVHPLDCKKSPAMDLDGIGSLGVEGTQLSGLPDYLRDIRDDYFSDNFRKQDKAMRDFLDYVDLQKKFLPQVRPEDFHTKSKLTASMEENGPVLDFFTRYLNEDYQNFLETTEVLKAFERMAAPYQWL